MLLAASLGCWCLSTVTLAKLGTGGKSTVEPATQNFEIACTKYSKGDIDGAIDAFLQCIYFSRNYYHPEAYFRLAVCYMDKKQDGKAIEAFKKSIEQAIVASPEAHLDLAKIYLRNKRLDEAQNEAYQALRDYKGKCPEAHNILGLVSEEKGQLFSAQTQFSEALGDEPWRYTEAWMNMAECLMKQKSWGDAVVQFHKMLNNKIVLQRLSYDKVFLDIGICLLAKGDHQGAIDSWREALNYNRNNADTHLQLAMLLDVEQHFSASIKEYQEFVRLSDDPVAVAKIKDRIIALDLKLAPKEAEIRSSPQSILVAPEDNQVQEPSKKLAAPKDSLAPGPGAKDPGF